MRKIANLLLASFLFFSCKESKNEKQKDQEENYRTTDIESFSEESDSLRFVANEMAQKLADSLKKVKLGRTEYYVVEGDLLYNKDQLFSYCQSVLKHARDTAIHEIIFQKRLTVATRDGKPLIWPPGYEIKYSVLEKSFISHAQYVEVVKNMDLASKDWMKACNIRFNHVSKFDNLPVNSNSPKGVTFLVTGFESGGAFIAESFLPGDPIWKQKILLDPTYFFTDYDKVGVMRHELGHIIGWRHEQIWSKDPKCASEKIIIGHLQGFLVNTYDKYSVMHYLCGDTSGTKGLQLTEFDVSGAQKIYGLPRL